MPKISREKFSSKYVRTKLVEDITRGINTVLGKDTTHVRNMDLLWKKAQRLDYDDESKRRIVSTILQKITKVLPKIQGEFETEALAEAKLESKEDDVDKEDDPDKGERKPLGAKGVNWVETSDLDFLEGGSSIKYHR